jgi:2-polyprenyl-3-methyl-5-hydroxy-6-metoxy-1,4-benzoquinol methylase
MTEISHLYAAKPIDYYSGARHDMVADLPNHPNAAILELGCGDGSTAALVRAANKAATYVGIELDAAAAARARCHATDVIIGDIASLDLSAHIERYDALIASEVLEHLVDPWAALAKLTACLKPGGLVLASSPNLAHWRVIGGLLRGNFSHTETGVMDRSHLRWFTPTSYAALFASAGLAIEAVRPITPPAPRTKWLNRLTRNRSSHLFMTQIYVIARKPSGVS